MLFTSFIFTFRDRFLRYWQTFFYCIESLSLDLRAFDILSWIFFQNKPSKLILIEIYRAVFEKPIFFYFVRFFCLLFIEIENFQNLFIDIFKTGPQNKNETWEIKF